MPTVPRNAWAVSVDDPPILHIVLFPDPTDRAARHSLCGTRAVPTRIIEGFVDICDNCREHLRMIHEQVRKKLSHAS